MKLIVFITRLKVMIKCLALMCFICFGLSAAAGPVTSCDQICGRWISSEKDLIVEVYKIGEHFKAKVVWFRDDPNAPMEESCDKKNPDPALRSRKIIGMEVLSDLKYHEESHTWEDGKVYDAQHGKEWNASAFIDKEGLLKVKGYWHLKLFGCTMTFKKV